MGQSRVAFLMNVSMYSITCSSSSFLFSLFSFLAVACVLFRCAFLCWPHFFLLEDGIYLHWEEKFARLCIRVVSLALDTTSAFVN